MNNRVDYYDILGVRPTARPAEIELAFKGRRTQYHPDKYGTADAETIRWATDKMQEVNEAYGVLSDTAKRARYDQNRQAASHNASAPSASRTGKTQGSEPDTGPAPSIEGIFASVSFRRQDAERIHCGRYIPSRKLETALACRRFFTANPPNQIHLLVDDTLFGGGAEGLLVTDDVVSFKELLTPSDEYVYRNGWNGQFDADGSKIRRFNIVCKDFTQISKDAVQKLTWGLNTYFAALLSWHNELALLGNGKSQLYLANSYHDSPEEKLYWLTLAAENGHVNAQHNLGKFYSNRDIPLAFHWFTQAARQGSEDAQRELQSDRFRQTRTHT